MRGGVAGKEARANAHIIVDGHNQRSTRAANPVVARRGGASVGLRKQREGKRHRRRAERRCHRGLRPVIDHNHFEVVCGERLRGELAEQSLDAARSIERGHDHADARRDHEMQPR